MWSTPRTWVAGELVTAALLNAHLRDNLLAIAVTGTGGARLYSSEASFGYHYNPAAAGGYSLYSQIGAEANPRFALDAVGKSYWGPGGSTVADTVLYRSAAGILALSMGALGVRDLVYGAADSAGSGYRQVRVTN